MAPALRCCQDSLPGSSIRVSFLFLPIDASALVAALTQFSHLAADTIINGSATSHLAPTDPADRKWAQAVSRRFSGGSLCGDSFQGPRAPRLP